MRSLRLWRNIYGVLLLLAILGTCAWLTSAAGTFNRVVGDGASEAYRAGAALGTTTSMGIIACIAAPALLLFGVLYWRTGAAIRNERQHQETIEALRGNDGA
jgi:hypothetical protein